MKITGNGQYQCLPNFPLHLFRTMGITRSHIFPASVLPFLHCLSGLSEARYKNKKMTVKKLHNKAEMCIFSVDYLRLFRKTRFFCKITWKIKFLNVKLPLFSELHSYCRPKSIFDWTFSIQKVS